MIKDLLWVEITKHKQIRFDLKLWQIQTFENSRCCLFLSRCIQSSVMKWQWGTHKMMKLSSVCLCQQSRRDQRRLAAAVTNKNWWPGGKVWNSPAAHWDQRLVSAATHCKRDFNICILFNPLILTFAILMLYLFAL